MKAPAIWTVLAGGFLFGMSLIIAVGAQNLYVLRQGVLRRYVPLVVAICAASDVVLIALGIALDGAAMQGRVWLLDGLRLAGAAFVFGYAVLAAFRAFRPVKPWLDMWGSTGSRAAVALACLAFTWLNPAAYLDTIVLIGTVANTTSGRQWWFGMGAAVASLVWFVLLGFGSRALKPVFARPRSWRVLDALTAIVMLLVGLRLILA